MSNPPQPRPEWLEDDKTPFVLQKNVKCRLGCEHETNMPSFGLFLFRRKAGKLQLLFEKDTDGYWYFLCNNVNHPDEDIVEAALKYFEELFELSRDDIELMPYQWYSDHGYRVTSTYLWAQPKASFNIKPRTGDLNRFQWFDDASLPNDPDPYFQANINLVLNLTARISHVRS
ncbi:hypothetical protein F5Y16DRAFT_375215 [Xylariaceae sp. FL0255]|nr:hypothetical protein F5Y16DRAFT_375215 [Xylariaceae sp. FL0255]